MNVLSRYENKKKEQEGTRLKKKNPFKAEQKTF